LRQAHCFQEFVKIDYRIQCRQGLKIPHVDFWRNCKSDKLLGTDSPCRPTPRYHARASTPVTHQRRLAPDSRRSVTNQRRPVTASRESAVPQRRSAPGQRRSVISRRWEMIYKRRSVASGRRSVPPARESAATSR